MMSNRSQKTTLSHLDAAPASRMTARVKKLLLWLAVNASIQFGLPILFYIYLERMVNYEYATGIRTSTDGDIILNLLRDKASAAKFEQWSHRICPSIANSAVSLNCFSASLG